MELLPPTESTFETTEECMQYIQRHAATQSYVITTRRTKFTHVNNERTLQTAYLHCCKSGTYRNQGTSSKKTKETAFHLIDCPFRASIQRRNEGRTYVLLVENPEHNYEPIPPIALPQHHELSAQNTETVNQMTMAGAMP
jgi:hypothetical protein